MGSFYSIEYYINILYTNNSLKKQGDNLDVLQCLKENKLKSTKPRVEILEIFKSINKCLTAMEIHEVLERENKAVDLSTVYRTLDLLNSHGIIDKFDLGEGKYNYKLKDKGHKHLIKCDICNNYVEIDCPMPQISEYVKIKTGVTLIDTCVNLNRGICKDCSLEDKKL